MRPETTITVIDGEVRIAKHKECGWIIDLALRHHGQVEVAAFKLMTDEAMVIGKALVAYAETVNAEISKR